MLYYRGWRKIEQAGQSRATELRKYIPMVSMADSEERKKGKLEAYAIKRVAVGAHLPTPGFLSLRNAQTIEPTTA